MNWLLMLLLTVSLAGPATTDVKTFEGAACRENFSFSYPSSWEAATLNSKDTGYDCVVGVRPRAWVEAVTSGGTAPSHFAIYVQISESGFLKAAAAAGFDFDGTRWTISRGEHPTYATLIGTKHWYGLRGDPNVRNYNNEGSYSGQGEIRFVLLHKPLDRSAIIETTTSEHVEVVDQVVASFRFLPSAVGSLP